MNQQEQDDWKRVTTGDLKVSKDYFHHHANKIVQIHNDIFSGLKDCFNANIPIEATIRTKQKRYCCGINAKDLNKQLRKLLEDNLENEVKFEVNEEKGVFYFSSEVGAIGGFDFAILNHCKNLISLRNLCFGELHYDDGQRRWDAFLSNNPDLASMAAEIESRSENGTDTEYFYSDEHHPLVVGEIQFGNWGLVYRDFFKVLKANVQNSIDCLVYIVPTGSLEKMLSDSIVTFDGTVKILKEFEKVISVPVWVVGLDIDFNG